MKARLSSSLHFYYAGAVMVLALTLGGGTAQGLWTDHLLQIALLPSVFLGFGGLPLTRISGAGRLLVVLVLLLLLLQFLPVYRLSPLAEIAADPGLATWSPAPQKSLESALFTVSILGFFLFLTRFSDEDQERFVRFLLIGFLVNFVAGVLQLSYAQRAVVSDVMPFTITAGLFANENHLSSLIYVMIPLLGYMLLVRYRLVSAYLAVAFLIVGFLFAVGSRAGMAIAGTLTVLSLLWFLTRTSLRVRFAMLGCWIAAILLISLLLGFDAELEEGLRPVFIANTLQAIGDYLPFGAGLGTFTLVYPAYEAREEIVRVYANHAHNDFLELFLETGLAGVALAAFFFVLVARSFTRSALSEAAFISLLALTLHSLVDYPLRTMALGIVFAWLAAVILSVRPFRSAPEAEPLVELLPENYPRFRDAGAGAGARSGRAGAAAGRP